MVNLLASSVCSGGPSVGVGRATDFEDVLMFEISLLSDSVARNESDQNLSCGSKMTQLTTRHDSGAGNKVVE